MVSDNNMTPSELKKRRHALGLSAEGFARLTGAASGRTVRRWEAGDNDIPRSTLQLLRLLDLLAASKRAEAVEILSGS